MFLVAGMLIGVVGTVAGSVFGLLLIWVQNTYKIIRLAGDVYQISYLPMKLTGSDFAMIVGATLRDLLPRDPVAGAPGRAHGPGRGAPV